MKQVTLKAEGLSGGGATSVCVNLIADCAGRLVNLPALSHDEEEREGEGDKGNVRLPLALPPVIWRAIPSGEMTAPVEKFTVTDGDIEGIAPLSHAALEKYSTILSAAYNQLWHKSREAGVFMQPVVARYRLTDAEGRTIFRSQPVAIALPSGWQCVEPVETAVVETAKGFTLSEFLLRANTFALEAEVPDYSAYKDVAIVELEISAEQHPIDSDESAAVAIRHSQSNTPVAAVALPGATSWLSPLGGVRAAKLAASGGVVAMHTVRRLPAQTSGRVSIPPIDATSKATNQNVTPTDRRIAVCGAPHGIMAASVARGGDTIVFGGITPLLWPGPHPAELLRRETGGEEGGGVERAESGEDAVGEVRVWFGNKAITRREVVNIPTDSTLSMTPMVTYPHPGATQLELIITRKDGSSVAASRRLTPTLAGDAAAAVESSLLPVKLTPTDGIATPNEYTEPPQPGLILAANVAEPANFVAATTISGSVTGMIAADRSVSSWDAARARLYLLATDGMYGVSANAKAKECDAMLMYPLNIAAVTWWGGALYAATDSGVMRLAGTQLSKFAVTREPVVSLVADSRNLLMIMKLASSEKRALSPDGVMTTVSEPSDYTDWEATVAVAPGLRAKELLADLRSNRWEGVIELFGSGPGERQLLQRVTIDGAVTRPVLIRHISAPHRARLTLRVAGRGKLSLGHSVITLG